MFDSLFDYPVLDKTADDNRTGSRVVPGGGGGGGGKGLLSSSVLIPSAFCVQRVEQQHVALEYVSVMSR